MPGKRKRSGAALKGWKRRKASESPPSGNRPSRLKTWPNSAMIEAIDSVKSGKMSANKAARVYEVPSSTLKDRLSGKVKHGTNPGPSPYLTREEETELHDFLVKSAEIGCGKTRREVISIVRRVVDKKGRNLDNFNGDGWWFRFMERNPELSLRTSDPLSRVRRNAVTKDNMDHYFSLLEKTLNDSCLLNKASRIYNMDETGMPLDPKPLKRVARRGVRKVHAPSSGDKSQITVVACANSAGRVLPPMVIFKGERFNHQWSDGEIPDTLYGMSESGWIDQELFLYWLKRLFINHIPPQRPVLLLFDGHSSHYTPEALREAAYHILSAP